MQIKRYRKILRRHSFHLQDKCEVFRVFSVSIRTQEVVNMNSAILGKTDHLHWAKKSSCRTRCGRLYIYYHSTCSNMKLSWARTSKTGYRISLCRSKSLSAYNSRSRARTEALWILLFSWSKRPRLPWAGLQNRWSFVLTVNRVQYGSLYLCRVVDQFVLVLVWGLFHTREVTGKQRLFQVQEHRGSKMNSAVLRRPRHKVSVSWSYSWYVVRSDCWAHTFYETSYSRSRSFTWKRSASNTKRYSVTSSVSRSRIEVEWESNDEHSRLQSVYRRLVVLQWPGSLEREVLFANFFRRSDEIFLQRIQKRK